MENFKIKIQYDGTKYLGWQIQNSTRNTIQGKLQSTISEVFSEQIELIGSGRTDKGVHALGQIANFHANLPKGKTLDTILLDINKKLPEDIAVCSIEIVDSRFHSRYSEKGKLYRYRIHVSPISNVLEKRFIYQYQERKLDIDAMRQAASLLVGTHDFKAFCGNKNMKKSTVRTIYSITFEEHHDANGLKEISIDFNGNGFLQNMIRIITGTLIEIGIGKKSISSIETILDSKNRANAGYTAPPQGLCLIEVFY